MHNVGKQVVVEHRLPPQSRTARLFSLPRWRIPSRFMHRHNPVLVTGPAPMKLLQLVLSLLLLPGCQKADPAPVDPLPPATQTGANTFGCLLNGQP